MKEHRTMILGVLAWLFLAIVAGFFLFSSSIFSLIPIGEEGYEDYDPLMSSGGFSPLLWLGGSDDVQTSGSLSIAGRTLDVSTDDDNCIFFETLKKTRNLYLEDFKAEYTSIAGYDDWWLVQNDIGTDDGLIKVFRKSYNSGFLTKKGSVELLWDDYETGHYNFFIDGNLVLDATDSDGITRIIFSPQEKGSSGSRRWNGWFKVCNPRFKKVFGCDLQEGELLVSKTFSSEDESIDLSDLSGFKRFCVDNEAQILEDGIQKTSKRVYYSLAEGESVYLDENHIIRLFWVADTSELGLSSCDTGAYELGVGCEGLTGFVSLDEKEEPILVEDKIDIIESIEKTGSKSFVWYANYKNQKVTSGGQQIFSAQLPLYDCASTDNHDSYYDVFRYPAPREDCWKPRINYDEISFNTKTSINSFWSAKTKNLDAKIIYDSQKYIKDEPFYKEADDWQSVFELFLEEDYFEIVNVDSEDEILASNTEHIISIDNKASIPLKAKIGRLYDFDIVDYEETLVDEVTLQPGLNEVSLPVLTSFLGKNDVEIFVLLELDGDSFSLDASNDFSYSFNIVLDEEQEKDLSDDEKEQVAEQEIKRYKEISSSGWFSNLWMKIKIFFNNLFGGGA